MLPAKTVAAISSELLAFQAGNSNALRKLVPLVQSTLERRAKLLIHSTVFEASDIVVLMWQNLLDPMRCYAPYNPSKTGPILYLIGHLKNAAREVHRLLGIAPKKKQQDWDEDSEAHRTLTLYPDSYQPSTSFSEETATTQIDYKYIKRQVYSLDPVIARGLRLMNRHGLTETQVAVLMGLSRFAFRRRLLKVRKELKY